MIGLCRLSDHCDASDWLITIAAIVADKTKRATHRVRFESIASQVQVSISSAILIRSSTSKPRDLTAFRSWSGQAAAWTALRLPARWQINIALIQVAV